VRRRKLGAAAPPKRIAVVSQRPGKQRSFTSVKYREDVILSCSIKKRIEKRSRSNGGKGYIFGWRRRHRKKTKKAVVKILSTRPQNEGEYASTKIKRGGSFTEKISLRRVKRTKKEYTKGTESRVSGGGEVLLPHKEGRISTLRRKKLEDLKRGNTGLLA